MKQLLLIITFLFSMCLSSFAQVTGKATLNGQSDHSGIKVKFMAQSPSAKTDSTYTITDGTYSINLQGGIYTISLSKSNFQTVAYSNGSSQLLTTSSTLQDVALAPGNFIEITGNVSGTWTKNNIYMIIGNTTVAANQTLTIEPGTEVRVSSYYSLTIAGTLNAIGTKALPIKFTSGRPVSNKADWAGIVLLSAGNIIEHTIVEYCNNCIMANNTSLSNTITNNEIRNFNNYGIYVDDNSRTNIYNNIIHDFNSSGIYYNNTSSKGIIECNTIYNGNASGSGENSGIVIVFGGTIRNNIIYNIKGDYSSAAINIGFVKTTIENNYIYDCTIGTSTTSIGVAPHQITDNIFRNNQTAIFLERGSVPTETSNNIFDSNRYGIYYADPSGAPVNITYNLFNNNDSNFVNITTMGIGQIVGQNSQNKDIDAYNNIFADPLFKNNQAPVLTANSPAWNTGKNNTNIGFNPYVRCSTWDFGPSPADSLSMSGLVHAGNGYLTDGKVVAINQTTFKSYEVTVNTDGTFLLDSIPAGNYKLYAIPAAQFSSNYSTTYYPNKPNESNAAVLTLTGHIFDLDLYLVPAQTTGIIDQQNPTASLNSYPNPFSSQLTIVSEKYTDTPTDIQVVNLQGLVVKTLQQTFNKDVVTLELADLPAGIYAIKLSSATKNDIIKAIKH